MDLLADILKMAGLKSRLLAQRSLRSEQSMSFPCARSLGFHVITQGEAQLSYGKNKKEILRAGDIALMSRGVDHSLKNTGQSELNFVSGVYQLWNEPIHPFFSEIPDWWILRASEISAHDPIYDSIKILSYESAQPDLGSESVMQSLLDILFNFFLRKIVKSLSEKNKSTWAQASQDEKVSEALKLMHLQYAHPWSLEELAHKVGLSRAGFAQKFKNSLGNTPLNYLTAVRIQHAMRMLTEADEKIELVATSVGYADAFTFSKSFKKRTGTSPTEFRKNSRAVATDSMRFV